VFSVSLWFVIAMAWSTTETQRTQRLHREISKLEKLIASKSVNEKVNPQVGIAAHTKEELP